MMALSSKQRILLIAAGFIYICYAVLLILGYGIGLGDIGDPESCPSQKIYGSSLPMLYQLGSAIALPLSLAGCWFLAGRLDVPSMQLTVLAFFLDAITGLFIFLSITIWLGYPACGLDATLLTITPLFWVGHALFAVLLLNTWSQLGDTKPIKQVRFKDDIESTGGVSGKYQTTNNDNKTSNLPEQAWGAANVQRLHTPSVLSEVRMDQIEVAKVQSIPEKDRDKLVILHKRTRTNSTNSSSERGSESRSKTDERDAMLPPRPKKRSNTPSGEASDTERSPRKRSMRRKESSRRTPHKRSSDT